MSFKNGEGVGDNATAYIEMSCFCRNIYSTGQTGHLCQAVGCYDALKVYKKYSPVDKLQLYDKWVTFLLSTRFRYHPALF